MVKPTIGAVIGLAFACVGALGPASAAPPTGPSVDPLALAIEAERWGVLLDRAQASLESSPPAVGAGAEPDALRIDAALKDGAAKLLLLRNDACRRGLASGKACRLPDWPRWTLEPPGRATPLAVLEQRSAWLGAALQSLVALACMQGPTASAENVCSVE